MIKNLIFVIFLSAGFAPILEASPLAELLKTGTRTHGMMVQFSYGLAAIATLGIAFLAYGAKFKWPWLLSLIGSLAIIASSGQLVEFVGNANDDNAKAAVFGEATKLSANTANSAKYVAYGVAALGVLGVAVTAFLGKFKWPWAWGIVAGLAVIAVFPDVAYEVDNQFDNSDVIVEDTGRDAFDNAAKLANNTANSFKYIAYALGASGALGFGVLAFMGRFQWRWFFMIVAGLVTIAGAYELIEYFGVTGTID